VAQANVQHPCISFSASHAVGISLTSELCSDHAASHRERIVPTIGVHHGHDVVDCAPAQCVYVLCIRIKCMFVYRYYMPNYKFTYNYDTAVATTSASTTVAASTAAAASGRRRRHCRRQSRSCCLAASSAAAPGYCRCTAVSVVATAILC
jgi:hypothetical protein